MLILQIILFSTVIIIASPKSLENNFTAKSTKVGHSSLWLPRSFRITCCLSGYPVPENPQIIRNWTHEESDYIIDERYGERTMSSSSSSNVGSRTRGVAKEEVINSKCRIYRGSYLLSSSALFTFDDFTGIGVACKCPEVSVHEYLDRSCRRLKPCLNNGHRSFDSSLYCICPEPYFGEQCEKYCDQGQRMRDAGGRDYCACTPFYQGEECRNIVCLNGGTELRHQCLCPPNFLGYHCEIDANRTSVMLRFHGYREQNVYQDSDLLTRDVSSTIFSLVMIAVLILSMYLLMKHRMQVQNRFTSVRREALVRSGIEINSRRGNVIVSDDPRIPSSRAITFPNEGPPPYVINPHRGRSCERGDNLPPLPTYEDATKLPPFIRPPVEERSTEEEEQVIENVTSPSELEINERVTETDTNDESLVLCPLSYPPESQHSLETATSGSGRALVHMHIFNTDNSSLSNKNLLTRKSI
uniref:EGF-like domain-containing protein n=1 Tax=Wuchereria bancrofti TaxID=6293 RepID=A0AAF5PTW1_WUCBA